MSQDKANNEAASAPDLIARIVDRDTPPDGRNDVVDHDLRGNPITRGDVEAVSKAASASQSSTAVPRVGGNTCDIFGCHFYGAARQCNDCTGSDLAHVARQRQESAAVAEGVDTAEFRRLLNNYAFAWSRDREDTHAFFLALTAHIETTYGAQQREAGRLELAEKVAMLERTLAVAQTALESRDATDAIRARQPVSEGLTKADRHMWNLQEFYQHEPAALKVIEECRAVLALYAAPPAKAEGMSDTDILNWLERKVVNVRDQLRYGSRDLFWSTPVEVEGELDDPSDLRAACRAAILAQQAQGAAE